MVRWFNYGISLANGEKKHRKTWNESESSVNIIMILNTNVEMVSRHSQ